MAESLLDQVRSACRAVARQARHVRLDHARIADYAASLPLQQLSHPTHDPDSHFLGHGEATVDFFLTMDTINFGSGYFPHLRKRPGMSGYFTVATSLKERFEALGPFSAEDLAALTPDDCFRIFGQDTCNVPVSELMRLFAQALNDLGCYVRQRFAGDLGAVVKAASASAEDLVRLLVDMPFFNDVSDYGGLKVPFLKRAQIAAADLWIAFDGQGPGYFTDLDRLTIFADNLVPHVLRVDGILRYDDDLLARINREELILAGSDEEIEIRATAVHAVELLSAELRKRGHDVPPMKLDYLLWNRGQGPIYKGQPRHRTRTVYY